MTGGGDGTARLWAPTAPGGTRPTEELNRVDHDDWVRAVDHAPPSRWYT
jgi:hypothetical protein